MAAADPPSAAEQATSGARSARLVERDGRLVATSETMVTDDDLFALIASMRARHLANIVGEDRDLTR